MGAILSFFASNPLIILGFIGAFVASGWYSDVKSWYSERHAVTQAVQPWAKAVAERDEAAKIKDQIAIEAIQARENTTNEIEKLRAQFEIAEHARAASGAPDCNWSDDDIRMLNNGRGIKKTSATN